MTRSDAAWASDFGLRLRVQFLVHGVTDMTDPDIDELSALAADELELRVGTRFTSMLTESQIDGFERLLDKDDTAAIDEFFQTNLPDYRTIVREEEEKILREIVELCRNRSSISGTV